MEPTTLETAVDCADQSLNQTLDEPLEEVLERGRVMLLRWQHVARAERLEAQAIELQLALEQARSGDAQALKAWLRSHDAGFGVAGFNIDGRAHGSNLESNAVVALDSVDEAIVSKDSVTDGPGDPSYVVAGDGWDSYLEQAQQRLQAIQQRWGDTAPWLDEPSPVARSLQLPTAQLPLAANGGLELDDHVEPRFQKIKSDDHRDAYESHAGQAENAELVEASPCLIDDSDSELSAQLSAECLATWREVAPESSSTELATSSSIAQLRRRLFGSYGLSILAHSAILFVLGTITYQPVDEGNSLGSQVLNTAEASTEPELNHEVEMVASPELPMSEPVLSSSESNSVAQELAQLSSAVSPISVEVPQTASASSSIAAALSAPSSLTGSTSTSRGTGLPSVNGSFFGVGTGGNYFCYVVDSSGSMRGGAWDSAKAELMRSLKSLKPTQRFYIIFFADEFNAIPEPGGDQPAASGLYATPDNIDHARRWIQSVELNRGGPPTEALRWAIEREPDAIYLLTDGVTKVDVCGQLRKLNRFNDVISDGQIRVPIHAIAYFSLDGQQLMRQLAKENEGQFIYVPKPKK